MNGEGRTGGRVVEDLWNASSVRLRAWFERRTGSAHVADDLLQETFLRVQKSLDSVREEERLAAWAGKIASNVLEDHYRAKAKSAASLDDDGAGEPAARDEEHSLASAVASWLDAFLAALPPDDAALLRAVDGEGLAQVEVARKFGLSPSGARSRVQRARAKLRAALDACCRFAFDARGNVLDIERRQSGPCACDGPAAPAPFRPSPRAAP